MDRFCRKCQVLVFNNSALCSSCAENLKEDLSRKEEELALQEKEHRNKWKSAWDGTENNEFLKRLRITNPYSGAIIFYGLTILIQYFGGILIIGYLPSFITSFLPEVGVLLSPFLIAIYLTWIGSIFIAARRLFYFLYKRIFKNIKSPE